MEANEKVKDLFEQVLGKPFKKTEEEEHDALSGNECPYGLCEGKGYIEVRENGFKKAKNCQCYNDEIIRRKLRNANMSDSYWDKELKLVGLDGLLLHPKSKPVERQPAKGKNGQVLKNQPDEHPQEFIERSYQQVQLKNGLESMIREYIHKTLNYLSQNPIQKTKGLILMGEPGMGKTLIVSMIGKTYLVNGKKVYFTTMRSLVRNVIDKDVDIEKIVSDVDLLIIDELGAEYHTENGWAITNIKEMLRTRYNKKLPVVCTTNRYPDEFHEIYDKSLMSLFHGHYFMVYVDRGEDGDYRLHEADEDLKEFGSFDI